MKISLVFKNSFQSVREKLRVDKKISVECEKNLSCVRKKVSAV